MPGGEFVGMRVLRLAALAQDDRYIIGLHHASVILSVMLRTTDENRRHAGKVTTLPYGAAAIPGGLGK